MAGTPQTDPIVVLDGSGPAGMACGLALHVAGQSVIILERYRENLPTGNILNLWPPPLKALQAMGVDTIDLGAANNSTFRNAKGKVRAAMCGFRRMSSTGTAAASSACCGPTCTGGCSPRCSTGCFRRTGT